MPGCVRLERRPPAPWPIAGRPWGTRQLARFECWLLPGWKAGPHHGMWVPCCPRWSWPRKTRPGAVALSAAGFRPIRPRLAGHSRRSSAGDTGEGWSRWFLGAHPPAPSGPARYSGPFPHRPPGGAPAFRVRPGRHNPEQASWHHLYKAEPLLRLPQSRLNLFRLAQELPGSDFLFCSQIYMLPVPLAFLC